MGFLKDFWDAGPFSSSGGSKEGGGWKTSDEHPSKGETSRIGPTHTDTYHTNAAGKRDSPHSKDLKVSGPKFEPSMRDVYPPKK